MSNSLWLSIGIPNVVVTAFPTVVLAIRGLLWVRNRLRRQPSRADNMKTLIELFPDDDASSTSVKQRVHWRAGLHEFDAQTRPSVGHPLMVIPLGLVVLLYWALTGVCLVCFAVLIARADFSKSALFLAYAVVVGAAAVLTTGFDDLDFRYTLMGERLDRGSRHLSEVRALRRELGLAGARDRLANRTYFRRKTYPRAFSRIKHTIMFRFERGASAERRPTPNSDVGQARRRHRSLRSPRQLASLSVIPHCQCFPAGSEYCVKTPGVLACCPIPFMLTVSRRVYLALSESSGLFCTRWNGPKSAQETAAAQRAMGLFHIPAIA